MYGLNILRMFFQHCLIVSTVIPTEERCFLTFSEQFQSITLNRTMRKPVSNIMLKYWHSHLRNMVLWLTLCASWVSCTIPRRLWEGCMQNNHRTTTLSQALKYMVLRTLCASWVMSFSHFSLSSALCGSLQCGAQNHNAQDQAALRHSSSSFRLLTHTDNEL